MTKISFIKNLSLNKRTTVILLSEEQIKNKEFHSCITILQKNLVEIIKLNQFKGKKDEIFPLIFNEGLVLFVGIGKKNAASLTSLRMIIRKALLSAFLQNSSSVEILLHDQKENIISAAIESCLLGTYTWKKHKTFAGNSPVKKEFFIVSDKSSRNDDIIKICEGINFARDLINDNADTITADYLEKIIRDLIRKNKSIKLEVLNKKELKSQGLNLHLAVNQGSHKEPKLIIVKYTGNPKNKNYTAMIGKGITFDTGGLNLKPTGSMETMRYDMAGAGAIIGILKNVLMLHLKKNIIFACAIAENAIGSRSYKPGDVIKSYDGKTVEIMNTDAEGRLVLADAIAYVKRNYKPKRIIDIATLTGACSVALGHDYTALIANDEDLSQKIIQSSKMTDDRVWRLPNYPEIKDSVKSKIADIKNTGYPKGAGGTITAAEFLRQFAEGTAWAHLDIASTAFVENDSRLYFGYGATGAGIRLLTYFIENYG